jgi:hypothetical protein
MQVKELKDYKQNLYTALSRDLSQFEKNFLLIAGAILGFSITFIQQIVDVSKVTCFGYLFFSWGFLLASVALMMFTFLKSSSACDELFSIVDNFLIDNKLFDNEEQIPDEKCREIKTKVRDTYTNEKEVLRWMRYISIGLFIVGVFFLGLFVATSLTSAL